MVVYLQCGVKTSSLYGSKVIINECRLEFLVILTFQQHDYIMNVLNAKTLSFLVIVVT